MERQLPLLEILPPPGEPGSEAAEKDRRDWILDDPTRERGRRGVAAARAALAAAHRARAA